MVYVPSGRQELYIEILGEKGGLLSWVGGGVAVQREIRLGEPDGWRRQVSSFPLRVVEPDIGAW